MQCRNQRVLHAGGRLSQKRFPSRKSRRKTRLGDDVRGWPTCDGWHSITTLDVLTEADTILTPYFAQSVEYIPLQRLREILKYLSLFRTGMATHKVNLNTRDVVIRYCPQEKNAKARKR